MSITYQVNVDDFGTQFWRFNDKLHRVDGPAVIYVDGTQKWWLNNELHRIGGPAVICADGRQEWYLDGKLHRVDGPAVIWVDGSQYWFLDDVLMSKEEHARQTSPTKELTVGEIEALLGHKVKIIK